MDSVALAVHLGTLFMLIPTVLYTDSIGLLWAAGRYETLPARRLKLLHRAISVGIGTMVASGSILFWDAREYLLSLPVFYVKMSFVATLIVNAFWIGTLMHIASRQPFAILSKRERIPLFVSGTLSGVSWIGTIVAATQLNL